MSTKWTHDALIKKAKWWLLQRRGCVVATTERGGAGWYFGINQGIEIADAIGWLPNHWSVLIECKTSKSDFIKDKEKTHRKRGQTSLGQERWYLAPAGIINKDDVPPTWGLLEIKGSRVYQTKKPKVSKELNIRSWLLESRIIFTELAYRTTGKEI